ncbi:40S ribosomal protein S13 [Glycine max]|nr:40S ribosomal protein S13 [Glycine max]
MGRMHSRGKGISSSALPYKRTPPSWLKISSQDVEENICKFAKKGLTPSQIGVILRDSHGIAQVNSVTGSKILRILKAHGLAPEIPEDLYHLIKKAVSIRKHLERNRKDKDSKFRLILVESRIHRLARYYKKTKKLPPVWKYESTTASTLGFRVVGCAEERRSCNPNQKKRSFKRVTATSHGSYAQPRGFRVVECAEERRSRNPNQKKRSFKRVTATSHGSYAQPRGISSSALPYKRTPPSWLKISSQDVEENICKFAKKGLTPSQIGVILRDSHGIAQVNSVTGSKILRILKAHGLAPEIPEDLYHLIKKAVSIRKHLERNRKDKDSKFRLILVESRIHRLARYYKKTKKLPPVWKYESTTASTLANS